MTSKIKLLLEEILKNESTELYEFKLEFEKENFTSELNKLKDFIVKEGRFKIKILKVVDYKFVILNMQWKGSNHGKYFIY